MSDVPVTALAYHRLLCYILYCCVYTAVQSSPAPSVNSHGRSSVDGHAPSGSFFLMIQRLRFLKLIYTFVVAARLISML